MASNPGRYRWSQLTYRDSADLVQDAYGWVDPRPWLTGGLTSLAGLRQEPVVLVLGERGFGKTGALEEEARSLGEAGETCVLVDLAQVSSHRADQTLTRALTNRDGVGARHVLLDALDDADVEMGLVLKEVLDEVPAAELAGVRLRIACRTSRWPQVLTTVLSKAFGVAPVRAMMAGLTREDALAAAQDHDAIADPEEFVAAIEARRLVPLACRPVTFIPLLESWAEHRVLPETLSAAYDEACGRLCRNVRRRSGQSAAMPATDLVDIAARAAVAVQFSGAQALADAPGPAVVALEELVGGEGRFAVSSEHAYTLDGLRQLTESGLLIQPGPAERWVFAHRSFQEYLAASYLRHHEPKPALRDALLMVGHGPTRRPASGQREVAGWFAGYDDTLFTDLLASDPEALLFGDLAARTTEDRLAVLEALLDQVRNGSGGWRDRNLYGQLDDAAVAERIAELIENAKEPDELLLALSLAEACPREHLVAPLLRCAVDPLMPAMVRTMALTALAPLIARYPTTERIEQLTAITEDPDPEVVGRALFLLWPEHIAVRDLLEALPRAETGIVDEASVQFGRLPEQIPASELPAAAAWCAEVLAAETVPSPQSVRVALRVLERIVSDPSTSTDHRSPLILAVARALIAAARLELSPTAEMDRTHLSDILGQHAPVRRAVGRAVLETGTEQDVKRLASFHPITLFKMVPDACYFAQLYLELSAAERRFLRHIMRYKPANPPGEEYAQDWQSVRVLREDYPQLAEITAHWYAPLDEATAAQLAEQQEADRQAAAKLTFDPEALRTALDRVAAPSVEAREAWLAVLHELGRAPAGALVPPFQRLDPFHLPSLPEPGTTLEREVAAAARTVLTRVPSITAEAFSDAGIDLDQVPELSALCLLEQRALALPELSGPSWAGLAAALLLVHLGPAAHSRRTRVLPAAAERAGSDLAGLLPAVLDRLKTVHGQCRELVPTLPAPTRAAMTAWAARGRRDLQVSTAILDVLARSGDRDAARAVTEVFTWPPSRFATGLDTVPVQRWLAAARTCVRLNPAHWTRVADILEARLDLVVPLLQALSRETSFVRPDLAFPADARVLERLYRLMAPHVRTPRPDPQPVADELWALRYQVLSALADHAQHAGVAVLERLADDYGEPNLGVMLDSARRRALDATWTAREPAELFRVLTSPLLRVVNDVHQLRAIVTESLERLQDLLSADNGWAVTLWNQLKVDVQAPQVASAAKPKKKPKLWEPKLEEDLSDFVATFLLHDLGDYKVVINREVQVSRPGLDGSRTDIEVQAQADKKAGRPELLTLIIETKGCWNPDLETALLGQLVEKYLTRPGQRAGIYLVGYYDDPPYYVDGGRKRLKTGHTLEEIRERQNQFAANGTESGHDVAAFVMDCRLPGQRKKLAEEEASAAAAAAERAS
jgi:hypothetical protein